MDADTTHFPIGAPAEWAGKQEDHLQYVTVQLPAMTWPVGPLPISLSSSFTERERGT